MEFTVEGNQMSNDKFTGVTMRHALLIACIALMGWSLSGCSSEPVDDPGDVDVDFDAGVDTDPHLDTDPPIDADPPVESGTCGGDEDEELEYDGEPAAPGESCGDCDDGVLVCDGVDALECVGASAENACGGCGYLEGDPETECGPCGDGIYTCQDDGTIACEGASDRNECGGCEELDGTPGAGCGADDAAGVFSCTTIDEVQCIGAGQNACGGSGDLDGVPGTPCGACNLGVLVCDGAEALECHDEDEGLNACGGCTPLKGEPDEMCGTCSGEWFCATDDVVSCDDSDKNACGGCADLGDEMPGDDCGGGSVWACDGLNEMVCPDEPTNACGGDDDLDELPGEICGECGDGQTLCTSPDSVVCHGASETNACGGCGLLPGEAGEECGTGATWECTDDGSMRCEIDEDLNACGGIQPLDGVPGQACGPCNFDVYQCDGQEALVCSGETACPDFLSEEVEVSEIEQESASFEGEILEMPPVAVTEHGFCWSDEEDPAGDDENCESLGEATEAGNFEMDVEDLEAGTEYFVVAYAISGAMVTSEEVSFWTAPAAPEVSATDDEQDRVTLTWNEIEGTEEYVIYRDGTEITTVEAETTTYDDFDADDAPAPEAPTITSVSDDLTQGIEIIWEEANVEPGTMHDYEVVAIAEDDSEGDPGEASGQKAASEVEDYEICIGGDCDFDDWMEVESSDDMTDDLVHLDGSAPMGTIDGGDVEASEGDYADFVRLSANGWEVEDADEQVYQVRAVSDAGSGEPSAADDGWGQRATDELHYEWFASALDASGNFDSIYGPAADGSHDDYDAPEDGSDRHYYVRLTADGAASIDHPGTDNPLVGFRTTDNQIDTLSAQNIGTSSATLRGRINFYGTPPTVEVGLCWDRNQPAEEGNCVAVTPLVDEGEAFETSTMTLGSGRQYYVRAYAEDENGDRTYVDHRSFTTRPGSPSVSATTNDTDEVTINWNSVRGATSYQVYRDGEQIATTSSTSYADDEADSAPVPDTPEIESASDDRTDGIKIKWTEPDTDSGTLHTYSVVAVNSSGAGPSGSATGRLDAPEIDDYEICIGGEDQCDEDEAEDWDTVDTDDGLKYLDEDASRGSITTGTAEASDATTTNHVELKAEGWGVEQANPQTYQIRVVSASGPGEASSADDGQGQRAIGDLQYQWFGSPVDGTGAFEPLHNQRDYEPATDGLHEDEDARENGEWREYFVRFEAAGTESSVDLPDVDGGQDPIEGRKASSASVQTLPAELDDVQTTAATLKGQLTVDGIPSTEEVGICIHTEQPAADGDCEPASGVVDQGEDFSVDFSDLEPGVTYEYSAYAETENVEGRAYGDELSFTTHTLTPPDNVQTENTVDHVKVTWESVDDAVRYEVFRDDTSVKVVNASESLSVYDTDAEPGTGAGKPELSVEDGYDTVELSWNEVTVDPGKEYNYTVTTIDEDDVVSAPSESSPGQRLGAVDSYEVSIEDGDWKGIDEALDNCNSDASTYTCTHDVPEGSIEPDDEIDISRAAYVDGVTLESDPATVNHGSAVSYQVRAVDTEEESGTESDKMEGRRLAGDPVYQWEYYELDSGACGESGNFGDLEVEDSSFECTDSDGRNCTHIVSDGVERCYRVQVTAEGVSQPVPTEAKLGYSALLSLSFATEPSADSPLVPGEEFDVHVQVLNQNGEEMDGKEIALSISDNEFAGGDSELTEESDQDGIARFDEIAVESPNLGYVLTASSNYENPDESPTESPAFDIVVPPVAQHSWISGEDGAIADGDDEATITIELAGTDGVPSEGVTPQFAATGAGNSYGECTATNSEGISTCTMTSSEVEEKTLEITDPVEVTGGTVRFFEAWDCDESGDPFGGGTGEGNDPYRLCSPDHLNEIGNNDEYWELGNHFVVAREIDMSGVDYNIIGTGDEYYDDRFNGTFDGNGQAITGLTIGSEDDREGNYAGLFGLVGYDGVIHTVVLEDVEIYGDWYVGGLAGRHFGDISDSYVTGSVDGVDQVGGLVGRTSWGDIRDSHATASVSGVDQVGGLVGRASGGEIRDSYATGSVNGVDQVGGLVGYNTEDIRDSYAKGPVAGVDRVGGLVGENWPGDIDDSYALGSVNGDSRVGGLVGGNFSTSSMTSSEIENSYSAGKVNDGESGSTVGGLIGENWEHSDVRRSFWDTETSGQSDGVGDNDGFLFLVQGLETEQFDNDGGEFDAWSFSKWEIGTIPSDIDPSGEDTERPILQWQDGW